MWQQLRSPEGGGPQMDGGKGGDMGKKDELIGRLFDALIWCSSSVDVVPGGRARKGWLKICRPLLVASGPHRRQLLYSPQARRRLIELKSRIATPGLDFKEQMKALGKYQALLTGLRADLIEHEAKVGRNGDELRVAPVNATLTHVRQRGRQEKD